MVYEIGANAGSASNGGSPKRPRVAANAGSASNGGTPKRPK